MAGERQGLIGVQRTIHGGFRDEDGNIRNITLSQTVVYRQYTKAREESTSAGEFCVTLLALFLQSIFYTIGWVTGLIVPIAMIVVGAKYMDACPEEPMIPKCLLVGGIFIVLLYTLNLCQRCCSGGEENSATERTSPPCTCCITLIYLFLAVWLIVGSVYVYRAYKHDFDDISCDRTVYTFSFWLLNAFYIFSGVIFVVLFCGMCLYCVS